MDETTMLENNNLWIWKNIHGYLKANNISEQSDQYGFETQDLYQQCCIYLVQRYRRFINHGGDPNKFRVSKMDLLHVLHDYYRRTRAVNTTRYAIFEKGRTLVPSVSADTNNYMKAKIGVTYETYDDVEFEKDVSQFKKRLSPRGKQVFELLVQGYNMIEITKILGLKSRQHITYYKNEIRSKWIEYQKGM